MTISELTLKSSDDEPVRRFEIFTGTGRRRDWSDDDKARIVAESYELNRRGMEQLIAGLKRHGLEHIPSHGNFVTFRAGNATAVNQKLLEQGVIVRPIGGYGLPEWLRVTIGTELENQRFLEALENAQRRTV